MGAEAEMSGSERGRPGNRPAGLAARAGLAVRSGRLSPYAAAALLYGLALVLCFHAILAHPGSRISFGFDDGTSTIRDYWAASVQHRDPFNFTHDALSGAPQGVSRQPVSVLANGALQTAFVWELRGSLGLIGAFNAFMLLGLFATGIAMFTLLYRLGCTFAASVLGGYIFAFSPVALERAYAGQLGLLQNWVFVVLAAVLLRLRERRSFRYAAAAGLVIAVAFSISAWQGLLAGFMGLVLLVVELVRLRRGRDLLRTAGLSVAACLVTLLAVSPILVAYERERSAVLTQTDFYSFAASISAYFLPSPRNPLLHWLSAGHPANLGEETLFFGYATWLLALSAVVLVVRRNPWFRESAARWRATVFVVALAPAAFLASLPSWYHLGPLSIPMPSAAIGLFSSVWRVNSRFGVLVGFALATLAALALSAFATRPGRRWRLLTPIAIAIVFCELLPGNVKVFDTAARPDWVAWLASEPRGIVATYPFHVGPQLWEDYWYQTVDRDPQFAILFPQNTPVGNGGRDEGIRLLARDIWRPETAGVLATEGVRYVVVHDDAYRALGQPRPNPDPLHYTLLKSFGDVQIFSVHAPRVNIARELRAYGTTIGALQGLVAPSLTYGGGFNPGESFNGSTGRWMIQSGQLTFGNTGAPMEVTLSGFAFSNQRSRLLELEDSAGRVLGRQVVSTDARVVRFGPFSIPAGATTLTLLARPGPDPIGGADTREASVFLETMTMTVMPTYVGGAVPS